MVLKWIIGTVIVVVVLIIIRNIRKSRRNAGIVRIGGSSGGVVDFLKRCCGMRGQH